MSVTVRPASGGNEAPDGAIDSPLADVSIAIGGTVTFAARCTDPDNHTPFRFAWNFGGGAANVTVKDPGAITFATPSSSVSSSLFSPFTKSVSRLCARRWRISASNPVNR